MRPGALRLARTISCHLKSMIAAPSPEHAASLSAVTSVTFGCDRCIRSAFCFFLLWPPRQVLPSRAQVASHKAPGLAKSLANFVTSGAMDAALRAQGLSTLLPISSSGDACVGVQPCSTVGRCWRHVAGALSRRRARPPDVL